MFAKCDVTSEPSVDAALAAARKAHGQERILVNCAGIGVAKRITRRVKETNAIEPHDLATFAKVIQVNLIGTFLMMAKSAIGMQASQPIGDDSERGVMICTSSVAAQDGQIGQVAYCRLQGRRRLHDAAGGARPVPRRHPRGDDHAGPVPDADVRRSLRGGAEVARGIGAVPLAPRQARPSTRRWPCTSARTS